MCADDDEGEDVFVMSHFTQPSIKVRKKSDVLPPDHFTLLDKQVCLYYSQVKDLYEKWKTLKDEVKKQEQLKSKWDGSHRSSDSLLKKRLSDVEEELSGIYRKLEDYIIYFEGVTYDKSLLQIPRDCQLKGCDAVVDKALELCPQLGDPPDLDIPLSSYQKAELKSSVRTVVANTKNFDKLVDALFERQKIFEVST